jgi:3-methyl-2-oxobutanoate hydroxymethyltransferase
MTILDFLKKKKKKQKITMLTAYDHSIASILSETELDGILVGDSLGNVFQGNQTTIPVDIEDVVYHTQAVSKAQIKSLIVSDMPFLSYQVSQEHAILNAGKLLKAGAQAVKIEGGYYWAETIEKIVKCGIPVQGHLGLCPQYVNVLGGYKKQGKKKAQREQIIEDAKRLQDAGVFSIVLECIPDDLAKQITEMLEIPTIGIGAGNNCDGQILVINDLIGLTEDPPSFAPQYCNARSLIKQAVNDYINDVTHNKGSYSSEDEMKRIY